MPRPTPHWIITAAIPILIGIAALCLGGYLALAGPNPDDPTSNPPRGLWPYVWVAIGLIILAAAAALAQRRLKR